MNPPATAHTPSRELLRTERQAEAPVADAIAAALRYGWHAVSQRPRLNRRIAKRSQRVSAVIAQISHLSSAELNERLTSLRQLLLSRQPEHRHAAEESAMACAVVMATRTVGLIPYPAQIRAAVGLLEGALIEMATGEGKTLSLALASVVVALRGKPHYILTANDYLSTRDAATMRPLYAAAGLTTGSITSSSDSAARKQLYTLDVVYSTARECVADYLRDQIVYGQLSDGSRRLIRGTLGSSYADCEGAVMRGLHSVFVDEADHQLIDDAATPLVISQPVADPQQQFLLIESMAAARNLLPKQHFRIASNPPRVTLTAAGQVLICEQWHPRSPPLQQPQWRLDAVELALYALHLLENGRHYLVRDAAIHIIDQSIGRILPQRSWSRGLHQLVELKESVPLTPPTQTIASLSFQRFFRKIHFMAGISGTLWDSRRELHRMFDKSVITVPPHRPCQRRSLPAQLLCTEHDKFARALPLIRQAHATGQPVLIGCRSLRTSEAFSRWLNQEDLPHVVLNAAQDAKEAAIIAAAGKAGAITIATNMAGRGVDISLGDGVAARGGLRVIQIEANPNQRIDRQLYGRCARQGQPGTVLVLRSLDEPGMQHGATAFLRLLCRALPTPCHLLLLRPFAAALPRIVMVASNRKAAQQRLALVKRDQWIDQSLG